MKRYGWLLALLVVFLLPACTAGGQDPAPEPEVTTLIYAKVSNDGVDWEAVNKFNRTHEDVQIEVKNYSLLSENGKHGIDLLMAEIAAGQVPDIIELGSSGPTRQPGYKRKWKTAYQDQTCQLPYRQMAEKGYLEDLWPYIENDPDLGRESVVEAPLKAAEVNGKLYTVFDSVWIHTLIGAESVVGSRTSWTLEELMEAFSSMPEEAVILDNIGNTPSMKYHMLSSYIYGFFDLFVDWETSQCAFDSLQFRNVLEFASHMPDSGEEMWREEYPLIKVYDYDTHIDQILREQVMLSDMGYYKIYHQRDCNFFFKGSAIPIGYPIEDGSVGSYFEPLGIKLAMSSACQNKEAAWEYIRQTLLPKKERDIFNYVYDGIPIARKGYQENVQATRMAEYVTLFGGETIDLARVSKEEWQEWEEYFNSITRCSLFSDRNILALVEEEAGAYFAGDRTLDDTVERIQRRAELYVHENM
jgi:ABC-type glycerol-3-phosphate transport system substrate-binding protein